MNFSPIKYCPLLWIFHGKQTNNKIDKLHERDLRIVYNDTVPSFEDLLITHRSFTNNHQNMQSLAIETNKALNDLPGENFRDFYKNKLYQQSPFLIWINVAKYKYSHKRDNYRSFIIDYTRDCSIVIRIFDYSSYLI